MTSRDFCYWLQGYFELSGAAALDPPQVRMVQRHLKLVFLHEIDPGEPGDPAASQAVHDGDPDVPPPPARPRPPAASPPAIDLNPVMRC